MRRWHAETNPQHTLPGSAARTLGTSSERVDSKPTTGRRT
jgi:hypothetical protein